MLKMDQIHIVRHKVLVEGKSQRSVALELGLSRNTVGKYLTMSDPSYRHSQVKSCAVLSVIGPRIDQLLDEWSTRTTAKQRITGSRIHRQLVEEGHQVSGTTVRRYLRDKRIITTEVFVPLVHRPGDSAQVDFFEVTVDVPQGRRKAWMFLMRSMYSGHDFVWLYDRCDQISFFDGHIRAFNYFGGIPPRLVYDNLSAAVKRVVRGGRELTTRFEALICHYLFEPCFARVATGHDKGGVESQGKHIRWQHLTPIPKGNDLPSIAQQLLDDINCRAATKPQAVRQVAPELIAELGEPFGQLWHLLTQTHHEREAARVLAHILAAIVKHGETPVTDALDQAMAANRLDLLALRPLLESQESVIPSVTVPPGLAHYTIESSSVEHFDHLLLETPA